METIEGVSLPFMPIGGVQELKKHTSLERVGNAKSKFEEIFAQELDKLKFSAHAQSRLESRGISISDTEINRLETAVIQAEKKGGNESLVLLDEKAFIISIPNRTVITVIDKNNLENNVFTNIDSAVFA